MAPGIPYFGLRRLDGVRRLTIQKCEQQVSFVEVVKESVSQLSAVKIPLARLELT